MIRITRKILGKKVFSLLVMQAALISGCVSMSDFLDSYTGLSKGNGAPTKLTPVSGTMSVEEAKNLVDDRVRIGFVSAPMLPKMSKSAQYFFCNESDTVGQAKRAIHFQNLYGVYFTATSAGGLVQSYFSVPGEECPQKFNIVTQTQAQAQQFANALQTLADAEKTGKLTISTDPDTDTWKKIANSTESSDFQSYLQRYQEGKYVDLAIEKLISTKRAEALARAQPSLPPLEFRPPMTGFEIDTDMVTLSTGFHTKSTRKVTRGELSGVIIESSTTTQYANQNAAGGIGEMKSTQRFQGLYSPLVSVGTEIDKSTGAIASDTTSTTRIVSGDPNAIFPLVIGNTTKIEWARHSAHTYDSGPQSDDVVATEYCLVDGAQNITVDSQKIGTYRLFCVSKITTTHDYKYKTLKNVTFTYIPVEIKYYSPQYGLDLPDFTNSQAAGAGQHSTTAKIILH